MTMGTNTMMPGATTLVFKNLAEVQADMAKMEQDNLALFTGSDGKSAGFFAIEQMGNTTALSEANQIANEQVSMGWMQFGESMGSALTQGIGLAAGHFGTKDDAAEADRLQGTLSTNQNSGLRVTGDEVLDQNKGGIPLQNLSKGPAGTVEGSLGTSATGKAPVKESNAETETLNKQTEENKKIQARIDNLRTIVANTQSRYSNFGQVTGLAVSGVFKAREGYVQKNITEGQGMMTYLQATPEMTKQAAGIATAAIQAELSAEQAAASAYQGVVSLTGAVRG